MKNQKQGATEGFEQSFTSEQIRTAHEKQKWVERSRKRTIIYFVGGIALLIFTIVMDLHSNATPPKTEIFIIGVGLIALSCIEYIQRKRKEGQ